MRRQTIYALGLIPLGLAYFGLKSVLQPIWFVVACITYAIVLRLCAEKWGH